MVRSSGRFFAILLGLAFSLLNAPSDVLAEEVKTLEQAVEVMANQSMNILKGRDGIEDGVFVEVRGDAGPKFTRELRAALTKRNLPLAQERDRHYVIDGIYAMGRVDGVSGITTKIVLNYLAPDLTPITEQNSLTIFTPEPLTSEATQEIAEVHAPAAVDLTAVSDETEATKVKAQNGNPATVPLKPENRSKVVKEALENPAEHPPQIQETVARFGKNSPYGIEIYKEAGGASRFTKCPLVIDPNARTPHVELERGDCFSVVVRNTSGRPVAVALSLDGINHFEFSTQEKFKDLGKLVVSKESGFIQGWYIDEQELRKFEIMDWGQAAAGQLGRVSDVGMITVTFFQVLDTGKSSSPPAPVADAVGVGASIKNEGQITRAVIGEPLGIVSIRYKVGHPPGLPNGE